MTQAYLRGGLSTCSVVWVHFQYFFLKFTKILMQLCKHFFYNFKNYGSYLLFLELFTLAQPFFWGPLLLRLSATLGFSLKMRISNALSSIFSDSTSQIASPFAKPQDSLPVGSISYFFSAPADLCPPLGVFLRPGPWSGRLLKRSLYNDSRLH